MFVLTRSSIREFVKLLAIIPMVAMNEEKVKEFAAGRRR
jgi:hypothetical protein